MEGDVSLHQDFLKETDAVLTHEMIASQTNVGFIKEITEKVKFIKDVISRNNLKTSTMTGLSPNQQQDNSKY